MMPESRGSGAGGAGAGAGAVGTAGGRVVGALALQAASTNRLRMVSWRGTVPAPDGWFGLRIIRARADCVSQWQAWLAAVLAISVLLAYKSGLSAGAAWL